MAVDADGEGGQAVGELDGQRVVAVRRLRVLGDALRRQRARRRRLGVDVQVGVAAGVGRRHRDDHGPGRAAVEGVVVDVPRLDDAGHLRREHERRDEHRHLDPRRRERRRRARELRHPALGRRKIWPTVAATVGSKSRLRPQFVKYTASVRSSSGIAKSFVGSDPALCSSRQREPTPFRRRSTRRRLAVQVGREAGARVAARRRHRHRREALERHERRPLRRRPVAEERPALGRRDRVRRVGGDEVEADLAPDVREARSASARIARRVRRGVPAEASIGVSDRCQVRR